MVGVWIAGFAGLVGFCAMILIAIDKVQTGRGLDTYRTYWLVEFNWIGFFVFLIAAIVALAVGLFFRYKEWREIRQLQELYSDKHD